MEAEAAHREAVAKRDADMGLIRTAAARAAEGIESRAFAPKKCDVEVLDVGIAWAAQ